MNVLNIREIIKNELTHSLLESGLRDQKKVELKEILNNSKYEYGGFFSLFNELELINILQFIKLATLRQNSGLGETVGKKTLRDSFFKTPQEFRKYFSVIPNNKLWRGDVDNPCLYDDQEDLYLQSFGNENIARFFGNVIYPATTIKQYGGSFSSTKFHNIITKKDLFYLSSVDLWFKLRKDYTEITKIFNHKNFYVGYVILKGYGVIGRKYRIALMSLLKDVNNNPYFIKDILSLQDIDEYSMIGDDESEVFFFDVVYDCNLINDHIKKV